MTQLSVADVLERAADRLSQPGIWNCRHCAATAIWEAADEHWSGPRSKLAEDLLARHINVAGEDALYGIYAWNDAPGRTQPEVVAKLREAAALARQQESTSC